MPSPFTSPATTCPCLLEGAFTVASETEGWLDSLPLLARAFTVTSDTDGELDSRSAEVPFVGACPAAAFCGAGALAFFAAVLLFPLVCATASNDKHAKPTTNIFFISCLLSWNVGLLGVCRSTESDSPLDGCANSGILRGNPQVTDVPALFPGPVPQVRARFWARIWGGPLPSPATGKRHCAGGKATPVEATAAAKAAPMQAAPVKSAGCTM